MKFSQLLGLGILVVGFFLFKESRKRGIARQTFNGISFNPIAIFIAFPSSIQS